MGIMIMRMAMTRTVIVRAKTRVVRLGFVVALA